MILVAFEQKNIVTKNQNLMQNYNTRIQTNSFFVYIISGTKLTPSIQDYNNGSQMDPCRNISSPLLGNFEQGFPKTCNLYQNIPNAYLFQAVCLHLIT